MGHVWHDLSKKYKAEQFNAVSLLWFRGLWHVKKVPAKIESDLLFVVERPIFPPKTTCLACVMSARLILLIIHHCVKTFFLGVCEMLPSIRSCVELPCARSTFILGSVAHLHVIVLNFTKDYLICNTL